MPYNALFTERKRKILSQLDVPDQEYTDLSPKGSVDAGIREFVNEINLLEGYVTTSSCAGRVAVFLDGANKKSENAAAADDDDLPSSAAPSGGKGGGQWLYVSHDPVDVSSLQKDGELLALFGTKADEDVSVPPRDARPRFVHFRFEPMILHILTSSLQNGQHAHTAAMSAGFRESGIHSIAGNDPNPIVAVRTMGLAFSSIIAYATTNGEIRPMVSETYLRALVQIANERFVVNADRTERFRRALLGLDVKVKEGANGEWEPADVRRERKRAEGLRRKQEVESQRKAQDGIEAKSDHDGYDMPELPN
ncbi:related to DUF207 domain protein [Ramularia collo-cygni]|uniref:tRNA(Phe) 7-[(3-amino-3-carboxypropyl)-4-demethylwyosine(37)-N(4)]-methyltransferase n=1 Tax=Ramularia collo-cygni TaxID=112498 RepID=A0A2D3V364_9PEZI|nr:related to DUF207 domain protein [Ramularia collo-cygni]CZT21135.1 related to DUF207 domain protein [Ramularia collo-cygni]